MANTGDFASGTSAFIRGFSFVDDMNSRRRQEAKLDKRLEQEDADRQIQRQIQQQQLAERGADRANFIVDRQTRLKTEQRQREANAILADPNAGPEELQPYADLPGVSAILRQQGIDVRDQADLQELQSGGGLRQQVAGAGTQSQVTQQPGGEGLSSQVKAALLPGSIGGTPEQLTSRDLSEIADTDGVAAAMQARDQQNAILALDNQPGDALPVGGGSGRLGVTTAGAKRRAEEKKQNRQKLDTVNSDWDAFADIDNQGGDGLRNLDSNILTAKYFDDRGSIGDAELRQTVDKRMRPAITETINTQQEIITNVEPASLEATNARRKLSEAYGLANEINVTYSPMVTAGVDDRGLPIGGNQALTDSVIEQGRAGPIASLPVNPSMTQADVTMLNRGASGARVNQRFATAAFRQYKNGRLNFVQYDSLMRTGALPVTAPEIKQTNPKFDTWAVNPTTGERKIIAYARDPDDDNNGRNIFTKEGLEQIRLASASLDTEDDQNRGFGITNTFFSWAGDNERKLTNMGYDFKNLADQAAMWNIFSNQYVIRDQLNDEVFFQGDFLPDFEERYGDVDEAIFNPRFQADFGGDAGRANRESITDFSGEAAINEQRLKQPRQIGNPAVYDQIRLQHPQFAPQAGETIEQSNQRIEAELQAQAQ